MLQAANLLRALRQSRDAGALGLVEGQLQPGKEGNDIEVTTSLDPVLSRRIYSLQRFLLAQLHRESSPETAPKSGDQASSSPTFAATSGDQACATPTLAAKSREQASGSFTLAHRGSVLESSPMLAFQSLSQGASIGS